MPNCSWAMWQDLDPAWGLDYCGEGSIDDFMISSTSQPDHSTSTIIEYTEIPDQEKMDRFIID